MKNIAFSKLNESRTFKLYVDWLRNTGSEFAAVNCSGEDAGNATNYRELLAQCSGLVLTGGEDVHPARYNQANQAERCQCDLSRDILDFALIEQALQLKMPIMATCRGLQALNVSQGGNLIVDIESDYGTEIKHTSEKGKLTTHSVKIDDSSNLFRISGLLSSEVVSVHHQAVKDLAGCFRATAFAEDGIIEAYEWLDPAGEGYLNAIQWHPEKSDFSDQLSRAIAMDFLDNTDLYHK